MVLYMEYSKTWNKAAWYCIGPADTRGQFLTFGNAGMIMPRGGASLEGEFYRSGGRASFLVDPGCLRDVNY